MSKLDSKANMNKVAMSIFQLTPELDKVLVTSDRELLAAGVESGMEVLDPLHASA